MSEAQDLPRRDAAIPDRPGDTRVLLVHNKLTPFVRIDRDALRAHHEVEELAIAGHWTSPWRTWQAIRRCDVVLCWFASAHSLLPVLLGRLVGRPVVIIVGGYDTANLPEIGYGHQRGGLKKYVSRMAMTLATHLIANSHYTRAEAIREAGVAEEKITVVYHGVPAPMAQEPVQDKERDLVVTVGNVDLPNLRRKGLGPFVRAAALLPDYRFVLIGAWLDGAIEHLRAIAPPNVTFTGRVSDDDLQDYLRRAAICVQASAHEGFGMAVAQAMAAGCVPVVTRAGALPEVAGDSGVYAASPDPGDLAAAIDHAGEAGLALGMAASARVARLFPLDARGQGLSRVLQAAVAKSIMPEGSASTAPASLGHDEGRNVPDTPASLSWERVWPLISVVIPARNEEHDIAACLEAVLAQDYPPDRVEVLVVDGRSADGTRAVVERLAGADSWSRVRLLDNPPGTTSVALNIGIRAARGDIIARVDGHTVITSDYLRRCVEVMEETGADNVGGLMRPLGRGYIGRCIALATTSRFGIGNSRFHYDERGGETDTVYLGCFRRSIFERVGLFDEGLVRNQDDELNDRIIAAGGHIWLSPQIRSTYYNRGSLPALWRQYYEYGLWKVRVLQRHRHARRMRHLAPAVLVAGLGGSAILQALISPLGSRSLPDWVRRLIHGSASLVWGVYGITSVAASVHMVTRTGWRYLPGLLACFWCLHVGYGSGFLMGLWCRYSRGNGCPPAAHVPWLAAGENVKRPAPPGPS